MSTVQLLRDATLSREPPKRFLDLNIDRLKERCDHDRRGFLIWLKEEFGLPLGDRQRIANALDALRNLVAETHCRGARGGGP